MDYVSNQEPQIQEMLSALGIEDVESLYRDVPSSLLQPRPVADDGLSELEGARLMEALAAKNSFHQRESYLGGGAYEHYIPALTSAVCAKSEFLTSYTPYQAEASQGLLQCVFEYQSALCALTGMEVSNGSLYDGAQATAEGVLMALRIRKPRTKLLIAESLHPHYRAVVDQYLSALKDQQGVEIQTMPFGREGQLDPESLMEAVDEQTAAVVISSPNFLGIMEDVASWAPLIQAKGALILLVANPLAYGLYASAGELGVDIAVGDAQSFGVPLALGGPYIGYMACRMDFVRQLPGRIVGATVDGEGRRGYVLTLQAREQHIRREKATSNICSNQNLTALAVLVTLLWYGKEGVKKLALTNYQRAAYLRKELANLSGFEPLGEAPFFNEFTLRCPVPIAQLQDHFRRHGIEPGLDTGSTYPQLEGCLTVAVTEMKNKQQLDRYVDVARSLT